MKYEGVKCIPFYTLFIRFSTSYSIFLSIVLFFYPVHSVPIFPHTVAERSDDAANSTKYNTNTKKIETHLTTSYLEYSFHKSSW